MTGLKISTEKLGQGAFGTVYRGNSGTEVAVKEISLKRTTEESKKQIYTEILLHSRVHHQNIVQFMAVSRLEYCCFIAAVTDVNIIENVLRNFTRRLFINVVLQECLCH